MNDNEEQVPYQSRNTDFPDAPNRMPPPKEEKEQFGLQIAVVIATVMLVLFGLYWAGKLLLMPKEEGGPKGPDGLEISVDAKCTDPTVYTDINTMLYTPKAVCKFDFSGQGLTELSPYIGHFTNLVELDISNNNINDLPSQIGWLTRLEKFDASNNNITRLRSEVGWLRELTEWNLSNNQLQGIPPEIGWLRKMENFNLANNNIVNLPAEMGWMATMRVLNLTGNPPVVSASADRLRPYMRGANIILP